MPGKEVTTSDDFEESVMLLTYAVRELTGELARFRRFSEQAESVALPSIRTLDTIRPPRAAGESLSTPSWHERLRAKQVRVPTATLWGAAGYLVLELVRAIVDGRIHIP